MMSPGRRRQFDEQELCQTIKSRWLRWLETSWTLAGSARFFPFEAIIQEPAAETGKLGFQEKP